MGETDIHSEYARQREHLERSVASLRKKLAKDTEIHRADYIRVMQVSIAMVIRKPIPSPSFPLTHLYPSTVICLPPDLMLNSHC